MSITRCAAKRKRTQHSVAAKRHTSAHLLQTKGNNHATIIAHMFTPENHNLPTFNVQRSTLNTPTFQRSTFNVQRSPSQRSHLQPSTFNVQHPTLTTPTFPPSTFNLQRSTPNAHHPNVPTFNLQPSTPNPVDRRFHNGYTTLCATRRSKGGRGVCRFIAGEMQCWKVYRAVW
jgi:hypothetical protein